jgi:phosphatidylglycerol lysyltransferase
MPKISTVSAVSVFLVGAITIAQTFWHHHLPTNLLFPVMLSHTTRSLGFALGLGLLYLAYQISRQKFVAWLITVIWLIGIIFIQLSTLHLLGCIITLAVLGTLLSNRSQFSVRSQTDSIKQAIIASLIISIVALGYGSIGFYLADKRDFNTDFDAIQSIILVIREYLLLGNTGLETQTKYAAWFLDSVDIMGMVSGLLIVISLFRPLRYHFADLPHERHRAKQILEQYGLSSEDFFKLWPHDKDYFFSSSYHSFIAYKVHRGIAIALGDPSGPKTEQSLVLNNFIAYVTRQGWQACLLYASPEYLDIYKTAHLATLKIGEDAIISLDHFVSTVALSKYFKYITRRFSNLHYSTHLYLPPHSPALLAEMQSVSQQWLTLPGRQERQFALGHFAIEYLKSSVLFVVRDDSQRAVAFINQITSYNPNRASIDLMRYRPNSPNGIMDYLFSQYFQLLHQQKVAEVNLGLAFIDPTDPENNSLEEKALRQLVGGSSRFFSIQGLRHFKSKYNPTWEARFLVYQGSPLRLPIIALAIYKALQKPHPP